jgi:hypothetical protein
MGEPVEVIHHIQQAGLLWVGPTAGILQESDETGTILNGAAWSIASFLGPP